jgi:pantothenate kinase type III
MTIIVDIGNTQVKWAVGTSPADIALRMSTHTTRRAVPAAVLRALKQEGTPSAIVIGSVVPAVTPVVQAAVRTWWPRVRVLRPGYREFKRLMPIDVLPRIEPGVDRLANALALRTLGAVPACAVDIGSAATLEIVDGRGAFVGGAILPGVALQYRALAAGTARVGDGMGQGARGKDQGSKGKGQGARGGGVIATPGETGGRRMPGQTTADAVAFGVERGLLWALAGLLRDAESALGKSLRRVVVTGGGVKSPSHAAWPPPFGKGDGSGGGGVQRCVGGWFVGASAAATEHRKTKTEHSDRGGKIPQPPFAEGDESAAVRFLRAQGLPAETDELLTLRGLMIMAAVGST